MYRNVLDALLPPGSLWVPEDGEGLDRLLSGMANNNDRMREFLHTLAMVRCPLRTTMLDDLERDYGIIPDETLDEGTRRNRLLGVKTDRNGDGRLDFMQEKLQVAGFNVTVDANSPPVDPALFLYYSPSAVCGEPDAICGESVFSAMRGEIVANGPLLFGSAPAQVVDPLNTDYYPTTFCGEPGSIFGESDALFGPMLYEQYQLRYQLPPDPGYWPSVFFISGGVTRDDTGAIIAMQDASIPLRRKAEFIRLIVKYKPMSAWAGLRAVYY